MLVASSNSEQKRSKIHKREYKIFDQSEEKLDKIVEQFLPKIYVNTTNSKNSERDSGYRRSKLLTTYQCQWDTEKSNF